MEWVIWSYSWERIGSMSDLTHWTLYDDTGEHREWGGLYRRKKGKVFLATSYFRSTDRAFNVWCYEIYFHRQEKFRSRITRISFCWIMLPTAFISWSDTLNYARPVFKLLLDLVLNSANLSTILKAKIWFRSSVIWRRLNLFIIVNFLNERASFLFTAVEDAAARCSKTSAYIYQTTLSQKMLGAFHCPRARCKLLVLKLLKSHDAPTV